MSRSVSGIEPGQRQLNGPQTTGRDYRNLSMPSLEMDSDHDVAVPMRDGIELRGDAAFSARECRHQQSQHDQVVIPIDTSSFACDPINRICTAA